METVELGGARLHVLSAWPGVPGESDRIAREIAKLDPAIILADVDTRAALTLRETAFAPSFVDRLFAEEAKRRFAPETRGLPEHPLVAAGRIARNKKLTLMPMRPSAKEPGFFARRRATKAIRGIAEIPQDAFPQAFADAARAAGVFDAGADADASQPRLAQALGEGRAPVLALLQPQRVAPFLAIVRAARKVTV